MKPIIQAAGTLVTFVSLLLEGSSVTIGTPVTIAAGTGASLEDGDLPWDDNAWIELAGISTVSEIIAAGNNIDIIKPIPGTGQLTLSKRISPGPSSKSWTIKCVEYDSFTLQLAALSTSLEALTPDEDGMIKVTPFSANTKPIRGWFQITQYDQSDNLRARKLYWAELRLSGNLDSSGTAAVSPSFTLLSIPNEFNSEWLMADNTGA